MRIFFLDASTHVFKRVCPYVRRPVRPSIRMWGRTITPPVTASSYVPSQTIDTRVLRGFDCYVINSSSLSVYSSICLTTLYRTHSARTSLHAVTQSVRIFARSRLFSLVDGIVIILQYAFSSSSSLNCGTSL